MTEREEIEILEMHEAMIRTFAGNSFFRHSPIYEIANRLALARGGELAERVQRHLDMLAAEKAAIEADKFRREQEEQDDE